MLLGLRHPTAGEIRLKGRRLRRLDPPSAWKAGIAYVPRERRREGLMAGRSVLDNTVLPHLRDLSRLGLLLDHAGCAAPHRPRSPRSSASRRRALARSCESFPAATSRRWSSPARLGGSPALLLLDEPTRGVDVGAKFDIYTLVRELSAGGCAVVISSSDLPELLGLCDRILILATGASASIVPAAGSDRGRPALAFLSRGHGPGGGQAVTTHIRQYGTLIGFIASSCSSGSNCPDTFMTARNLTQRLPADQHAGGGRVHHDHGHGDGRFRPQRRLDGQPRRHRRRGSVRTRPAGRRRRSLPRWRSASSAACSTASWSRSSASCRSSRRWAR